MVLSANYTTARYLHKQGMLRPSGVHTGTWSYDALMLKLKQKEQTQTQGTRSAVPNRDVSSYARAPCC